MERHKRQVAGRLGRRYPAYSDGHGPSLAWQAQRPDPALIAIHRWKDRVFAAIILLLSLLDGLELVALKIKTGVWYHHSVQAGYLGAPVGRRCTCNNQGNPTRAPLRGHPGPHCQPIPAVVPGVPCDLQWRSSALSGGYGSIQEPTQSLRQPSVLTGAVSHKKRCRGTSDPVAEAIRCFHQGDPRREGAGALPYGDIDIAPGKKIRSCAARTSPLSGVRCLACSRYERKALPTSRRASGP